MKERCKIIFSDEMLSRITWNGEKYLRVDTHGMSKNKALHFIQSLLLLNFQDDFVLEVVHGFHKGHVIKEALLSELQTRKPYEIRFNENNPGITRFVVSGRYAA